ncbi:transcription repressor NadR [Heyndrickxia ginsengihumi]|uniref:Transcription repressor NadR n=1 Tax=Heyndrickxia ginsengihumi TaxID=363870 RepID=A0A0A6VF51_9BACI|nr:transcription repressor NadR [Heyndrickxia ginsengihumi]KHD86865.1 transcriptional regulator [Heyndrickxia ginsengihumi]MBE6184159.1 transcription repressor NadR [Bacillus sp. (in: firmicutes)]MCM3021868.1 transcription repressor NadR [Heyndrickxia ginsengihumi]NEY20445.1 transcription repressor NadR [Heyndrickxia ginsengihumi]
MTDKKKILGDERRQWILQLLKHSSTPITGGELAKKANVSRQIIVNDITLLKAKNEPIIATSQGYLFLQSSPHQQTFEKTIVCSHSTDRVQDELNALVDHGVTVKDVKIEHPVYGDLTASIMVSNRQEVGQFIQKIHETKASYLSVLTGGIHIHTIEAPSEEQLNKAEETLREMGILFTEK